MAGVSVLAACTSSSPAPGRDQQSQRPDHHRASLSLTGDFSADGQAFDKGYLLWAKDVNAHGGLLGRRSG